jgi:hypothetical protein
LRSLVFNVWKDYPDFTALNSTFSDDKLLLIDKRKTQMKTIGIQSFVPTIKTLLFQMNRVILSKQIEITSMKKGFLLFLCSLCYLDAFGQIPMLSFDNLESCNLKGKVKKIQTTSFLAEKVNNKFVKTTKGWQYSWEFDQEFYYNTLGFLELTKVIKNGTTSVTYSIKLDDKKRVVYDIQNENLEYYFTYDSLNNICSAKEIVRDKQLESDFRYYYNDKNSIIKKEEYQSDQLVSRETFSYDSSNNLVKIEYIEGTYSEMESFEYDSNNLLIKHEWSDNEEGMIEISSYQYVNKQKTLEHWLDYEEGEPDGSIDYTYENGNEIEVIEKDGDGVITGIERNSYEYDSTGNWIKMYIDDGEKYYIVERTISYY